MDCMPRYLEFVFLYPSNREGARSKWCREHGNWTVSDWGNVMFAEESRFSLEPDDKRIRIWRKQGTRNQLQNITEHHAFRGGSFKSEEIARMAGLAYSPDLNPIENLWDALGLAVSSRFPPPAALIELETALQEEWRFA
ncbi:transposable element Tcb1 transposase [Trichonephila clavipes]|nr:transposable element Tcb1 transposase [Trichonephila clavipes]